jgi:transcriptional regulatory protein LevR
MTQIEPAEWEQQLREVSTEFRERLDMLEESGQVTSLVRWMTENAVARIAQEFGIRLTEDNASQFVTHMAMALARLQRGDTEAPPSAALADEIADRDRERDLMRRIMDECEEVLDREIPESELDYMTVHLCALVEEDE